MTDGGDSSFTYPVPPEADDDELRHMWDYWLARSRDGRLPARGDIEPLDLRAIMGALTILDVIDSGGKQRFQYRLWGTRVLELFGEELTGKFADELGFDPEGHIQAALEDVRRTGKPHFWQRPLPPHRQLDHVSYRRLALPLGDDGETVDRILLMMVGDARPED
ncbi:MAG: PAS domain-containing protein [Alphaproteobacteria bacterium]